jgi:hypothetical protein
MFVWLVIHDYNDRIYGIYASKKLAEAVKAQIENEGYYMVEVMRWSVEGKPDPEPEV